MKNKRNNLDKLLDNIKEKGERPKILLHSCCGPCSTSVIDYLIKYMDIVVLFYNPNFDILEEFNKRLEAQKLFLRKYSSENNIEYKEEYGKEYISLKNINDNYMELNEDKNITNSENFNNSSNRDNKEENNNFLCEKNNKEKHKITLYVVPYNHQEFSEKIYGLENEREGGKRCSVCFYIRLLYSGIISKKLGCDYFASTLSVSPHKNSIIINNIGKGIEKKLGIKYLVSDFKKKNGYLKSVEFSNKYEMYRQNYCGCNLNKRG